jgi:hypothetical protein
MLRCSTKGVDVWRPVDAENVGPGRYRLLPLENPDPTEHWEFPPGSVVACEIRDLHERPTLVATRLVGHD